MCVSTPIRPKQPPAARRCSGLSTTRSSPLAVTYSIFRTRSLSVRFLLPAPWHIGALEPPIVISTIMILSGRVTWLFLTHHLRSLSFVQAVPIRTSVLPALRGLPGTISIVSNSVGGESGSGRASRLGSFEAVWRFNKEMRMWPFLANIGDHE